MSVGFESTKAPLISRWDAFGMRLAWEASRQSKDPSTKVGCYISDQRQKPVSFGFNGFPQGILDDDRLHERDTKYKMILHGEENAILTANRDLDGCTAYLYPFICCTHCASMLIQKRIARVVAPDLRIARWSADFDLAESLLKEAGVSIVLLSQTTMESVLHPPLL